MAVESVAADYPVTWEQEAIWVVDALSQDDQSAYVELWAHRLRGPMDPESVRWALRQIVDRHEALRSIYVLKGGRVVQTVQPEGRLDFSLSDCPAEELSGRLADLAAERLDLARAPLRAELLRIAPDDWVLAVLMHHLVIDDWAFGEMDREFGELYRARTQGRPQPLDPLPLQMGPYAQRQRSAGVDPSLLAHWRGVLDGAPALSTVPPDHPRPAELGTRGGRVPLVLERDLVAGVRRIARTNRTTPFVVLAAAVTALLHRHNGQEDLVLGVPVSRRGSADVDGLVACLTDTMPLRCSVGPETSFAELVAGTRSAVVEMMRHKDVPLTELVRETGRGEDLSRSPLFQTVLVVDDAPRTPLGLPGVAEERLYVHSGRAKFDLCLTLVADHGDYRGFLDYASDLFLPETAERVARRFRTLLASAVAQPEQRIGALRLLPPEEEELVTGALAAGAPAPGRVSLVHEAFDTVRAAMPQQTAVVWRDRELTYAELGDAADRLARRLMELGTAGEPVGILLDRSFDLTVAVLAALKARLPYVPLDPQYPPGRVQHMVEDSAMRVLLTHGTLPDGLLLPEDMTVLRAEDGWAHSPEAAHEDGRATLPTARSDDLAYIMYTSGSSGRAKGVQMHHGALANLVDWQCRNSSCGAGDRTLQFAALSFDVSFQEMFSTWAAGGTLVLVDADERADYDALSELMEKHQVKRLFVPFVALQAFAHYAAALDLPGPSHLTEVVTAGEPLQVSPAIRRFFTGLGARLVNQYGPTETHVVTCLELSGDPSSWPSLPTVGRPVDGVRVYVLDDAMRPQPIGVAGELCVAGVAVAHGYQGMPELTAERFVPDPFVPGALMYRTGDVAVLLPDGLIQLLGRLDGQVKIRGHRVELGEIEAALRAQPGIADAAVVLVASGGRRQLTAHYAAEGRSAVDEPALRRALLGTLPGHMVPEVFVRWAGGLPCTPSGKVDRKALSDRPSAVASR